VREIESSAELLVCARACVSVWVCARGVFFPLGPTDRGDARDVLCVRISLFQLRLVNRRERRPPNCGDWCGGISTFRRHRRWVFESSIKFLFVSQFSGARRTRSCRLGARIVCLCVYVRLARRRFCSATRSGP